MILKNCQLCNEKLVKIFSLGMQPLCDDLKKIGSKKKNKLYKTDIIFCEKCIIAYNKFHVNPKKLFPKSYHYRSNLTKDVLNGMEELVLDTKRSFGCLENKKVLDIGCNDGSLLNFFKSHGAMTIGVEPTNACRYISKHKIYNNFFNTTVSKKIKKDFGNIDFIVFTNVFAHINNLKKLISDLKIIISNQTNIIIENHYLGSVIDSNQFDTFYHEHPRTYSLTSLIKISELLGMKLSHFKFPKRYGGNIRVIFTSSDLKFNKKRYEEIFRKEKKFFYRLKKMRASIHLWKKEFIKKMDNLKKKNINLIGKAFPGRASILINFLDLDKNHIKCIYEKPNSLKVGHYVPNTNIPIISDNKLNRINKKDVIINFAWHIKKEIKEYLIKKKINNKIINII